jgi:quercetin dioxygenase-like cupin family protein
MSQPSIVRKPLLTAPIEGQKLVSRVEINEIKFAAHQKTGLHLHPCPVVGYIAEGTILFQAEGQSAKALEAGAAFYEPANTKIVHFDNQGEQPAKFIAYYLLGRDDHELIRRLEE